MADGEFQRYVRSEVETVCYTGEVVDHVGGNGEPGIENCRSGSDFNFLHVELQFVIDLQGFIFNSNLCRFGNGDVRFCMSLFAFDGDFCTAQTREDLAKEVIPFGELTQLCLFLIVRSRGNDDRKDFATRRL